MEKKNREEWNFLYKKQNILYLFEGEVMKVERGTGVVDPANESFGRYL
jgi:hypothetical protein